MTTVQYYFGLSFNTRFILVILSFSALFEYPMKELTNFSKSLEWSVLLFLSFLVSDFVWAGRSILLASPIHKPRQININYFTCIHKHNLNLLCVVTCDQRLIKCYPKHTESSRIDQAHNGSKKHPALNYFTQWTVRQQLNEYSYYHTDALTYLDSCRIHQF